MGELDQWPAAAAAAAAALLCRQHEDFARLLLVGVWATGPGKYDQ